MRGCRWLVGCLLFGAVSLVGLAGAAAGSPCDTLSPDDKARYSGLASEGDQHAKDGTYEDALRTYREAESLCPYDPGLDFRIARVEELRGECALAVEIYREVVRKLQAGVESRLSLSTAQHRLASAVQSCSTGRLEVTCMGQGVSLSIDDARATFPCPFEGALTRGTYLLTATAPGREALVRKVVIEGGKVQRVELPALDPKADEGGIGGLGVAGWVTLGVGVGAAGAGAALFVLADSERDAVREPLVQDGVVVSLTHKEAFEIEDKANGYDTFGVVLVGVGGAAMVTGLVLILLDEGPEDSGVAILAPLVGPDTQGLILTTHF